MYTVVFDVSEEQQKTKPIVISLSELKQILYYKTSKKANKKNINYMYEFLKGKIIPYFDVEKKIQDSLTKDEFISKQKKLFLKIQKDLKRFFPEGKYYYENSSRFVESESLYKLSFHVKIRGIGYANSGIEIMKFLDENKFSPEYDRHPYKRRDACQFFRTIYSMKFNDLQSKSIPVDENMDPIKFDYYNPETFNDIQKYFIQNIDDENEWFLNGLKTKIKQDLEGSKEEFKEFKPTKYNKLTPTRVQILLNNIPNEGEGVIRKHYEMVMRALKSEAMRHRIDEDKAKEMFVEWAIQSNKEGKRNGSDYNWDGLNIIDEKHKFYGFHNLVSIARQYNPNIYSGFGLFDKRILTDDGLAEIFLEISNKNDIFAGEDDKKYYLWNPETALYERKIESSCEARLTKPLTDYISQIIENVINTGDEVNEDTELQEETSIFNEENIIQKQIIELQEELESYDSNDAKTINKRIKELQKELAIQIKKKESFIKTLNKIKIYVGSANGCRNVFKKIRPRIVNNEMVKQINMLYPYLLPCKNKQCIDLRTGKSISRLRQHMFSWEIKIEYDEFYDIKYAKEYIEKVFNTPEEINFIGQILAYCYTGEYSCKIFFHFFGPHSNNSKSAFKILFFDSILGDFSTTPDSSIFFKTNSKKSEGSHSSHLKILKGKRVIVLPEAEEDDELNNARIKSITGGDEISSRGAYQEEPENIRIIGTPIVMSNRPYKFSKDDDALKSRLVVVAFKNRFYNDEIEYKKELKNLEDKKEINACDVKLEKVYLSKPEYIDDLKKNHLQSFLKYVVEQCILFYKSGCKLTQPDVCREVMKSFYENDEFSEWYNEYIAESTEDISFKDAFQHFKNKNWESKIYKSNFQNLMRKKVATKRKASGMFYLGVQIKKD